MKTNPLKEKRFFQIYETSEPILAKKINPKDVKEGKDYILVTKEGYTLKTAPFGDISYYEIYEVEKNSE
ncbi:hypothetical protein QIU19_13645 [Capnocytophaga canimorsus]|nr:hypothetical protein [Capnocytophaga canimorsus]WGU68290.1 hypothetical protein QIU19_13645 [Capnocytophaga canimorsus]